MALDRDIPIIEEQGWVFIVDRLYRIEGESVQETKGMSCLH